jgi:hypothetical protein
MEFGYFSAHQIKWWTQSWTALRNPSGLNGRTSRSYSSGRSSRRRSSPARRPRSSRAKTASTPICCSNDVDPVTPAQKPSQPWLEYSGSRAPGYCHSGNSVGVHKDVQHTMLATSPRPTPSSGQRKGSGRNHSRVSPVPGDLGVTRFEPVPIDALLRKLHVG